MNEIETFNANGNDNEEIIKLEFDINDELKETLRSFMQQWNKLIGSKNE